MLFRLACGSETKKFKLETILVNLSESMGSGHTFQYEAGTRRLYLTERGVLTVSHPVAGKEECLRLGEGRTASSLCGVSGPGDC